MNGRFALAVVSALLLASTAVVATAVTTGGVTTGGATTASATSAGAAARDLQQRIGIDPRLGERLPLDAPFRDERGASRTLGELIHGRPAIFTLVYFNCPNLCSVTLDALSRSVARAGLEPGTDFQVVAISIDPREGPAQAAAWKRGHHDPFGTPAWHLLTGDDASIGRVARSLGYRYFWDPRQAQYAHPAGAVVVSGTGRIVEYLNGVEFPEEDLRRALALAAAGRSGSVVDRFWLLCYHYQALAGRYAGDITIALRLLGAATIAFLGLLLVRLIRIRG